MTIAAVEFSRPINAVKLNVHAGQETRPLQNKTKQIQRKVDFYG